MAISMNATGPSKAAATPTFQGSNAAVPAKSSATNGGKPFGAGSQSLGTMPKATRGK